MTCAIYDLQKMEYEIPVSFYLLLFCRLAAIDASRKVVVMFNLRKLVVMSSLVAVVTVSSISPAYAASYSCDTATENFFSGNADQGNGGSNGSSSSGSSTNGTTEDFKPDNSNINNGSQTPSDSNNGNTGNNGSQTSSDSNNGTVGDVPTTTPTERVEYEYVYVTVPSSNSNVATTAAPSVPSLDEKSTTDGVPASVKKNWAYKLNSSKKLIALQKYIGAGKKVSVPGSVKVNGKNYEVVLAKKAFYGNTNITSVSINKKVRTSKGSAYKLFFGCANLRTVKGMPWDITYLNKTFMGCKNLKSVSGIPTTVINANYAFSGCKKLQTVKLSSNLTSAYAVFNGCKSLKSVKGISAKRAGQIKGFYRGVSTKIVK